MEHARAVHDGSATRLLEAGQLLREGFEYLGTIDRDVVCVLRSWQDRQQRLMDERHAQILSRDGSKDGVDAGANGSLCSRHGASLRGLECRGGHPLGMTTCPSGPEGPQARTATVGSMPDDLTPRQVSGITAGRDRDPADQDRSRATASQRSQVRHARERGGTPGPVSRRAARPNCSSGSRACAPDRSSTPARANAGRCSRTAPSPAPRGSGASSARSGWPAPAHRRCR